MIDLRNVDIRPINGILGFCYNETVYIHIESCANILNLKYVDGFNSEGIPRYYIDWKRLHERYACSKELVIGDHKIDNLYPEDYVPKNKIGPKSKHAMRLPTFVHEEIFLKMASFGNYNSAKGSGVIDRYKYIEYIINQFKGCNTGVAPCISKGEIKMKPNKNAINLIDTFTNPNDGSKYQVLYRENKLYIEKKAAAHQLGLE